MSRIAIIRPRLNGDRPASGAACSQLVGHVSGLLANDNLSRTPPGAMASRHENVSVRGPARAVSGLGIRPQVQQARTGCPVSIRRQATRVRTARPRQLGAPSQSGCLVHAADQGEPQRGQTDLGYAETRKTTRQARRKEHPRRRSEEVASITVGAGVARLSSRAIPVDARETSRVETEARARSRGREVS